MPFFQNLFTQDFEGNWLLGDRHHVPKFVCPRNSGRGDELVVVWNEGPYDLTGQDADGVVDKDLLNITFALNDQKAWASIQVDIGAGAADASAVTPQEIISNLNANSIFADRFTAYLNKFDDGKYRINIKQKKPVTQMKFYVENSGACAVLGINSRAGVAELPGYFGRHSMENRYNFEDSQNHLIALDPANAVDAYIINNAVNVYGVSLGFDSTSVREDWALLEGKSGLFDFTNAIDGSTTVIYPAGAKAGDLAKKIVTDSGNTFVMPHTLESGDLITPP